MSLKNLCNKHKYIKLKLVKKSNSNAILQSNQIEIYCNRTEQKQDKLLVTAK